MVRFGLAIYTCELLPRKCRASYGIPHYTHRVQRASYDSAIRVSPIMPEQRPDGHGAARQSGSQPPTRPGRTRGWAIRGRQLPTHPGRPAVGRFAGVNCPRAPGGCAVGRFAAIQSPNRRRFFRGCGVDLPGRGESSGRRIESFARRAIHQPATGESSAQLSADPRLGSSRASTAHAPRAAARLGDSRASTVHPPRAARGWAVRGRRLPTRPGRPRGWAVRGRLRRWSNPRVYAGCTAPAVTAPSSSAIRPRPRRASTGSRYEPAAAPGCAARRRVSAASARR